MSDFYCNIKMQSMFKVALRRQVPKALPTPWEEIVIISSLTSYTWFSVIIIQRGMYNVLCAFISGQITTQIPKQCKTRVTTSKSSETQKSWMEIRTRRFKEHLLNLRITKHFITKPFLHILKFILCNMTGISTDKVNNILDAHLVWGIFTKKTVVTDWLTDR